MGAEYDVVVGAVGVQHLSLVGVGVHSIDWVVVVDVVMSSPALYAK